MTDYIIELVRQADRDRYISLLFAPKDKRLALASLIAFNIETARIARRVHDPLIGEIRLRWWRDAIMNNSCEDLTHNPVADAVLSTISHFDLSRQVFINACEVRLFDFYDDPMQTRTDFEGYCGVTESAFFQLASQVLDAPKANACVDASGHSGIVIALSTLLRQLPSQFATDQKFVPTDILKALGIDRQEIYGNKANKAAQLLVLTALIAWAREHFLEFQLAFPKLPPITRCAFLPIASVPYYLAKLERLGAEAFTNQATVSPAKRQWIMMKTAITGRFPPLKVGQL